MTIINAFEIMGTIAFALSGAAVGMQKKMDIFGVCIMGLTTAIGGGVLRDIILGLNPPTAFQRPEFAAVAVITSALLFLKTVRNLIEHQGKVLETGILYLDSIGLALFTVVGVQVAEDMIGEGNLFLASFVGVLTGVGGGLLRDVFACNTPIIFTKHFYASASIAGAMTCAILWTDEFKMQAMFAGAMVIIILRLMAAHYHWNLPKV